MKKILIILVGFVLFSSCDVDYFESPNDVTTPPTSALFNDAAKKTVDDLYDQWFSGRFTQVVMQYWTQTAYADEDRYVFRESQRETWEDFYLNLENFRKVIQLNTDEETAGLMTAYGSNENQIATSRIMMAWLFNVMTDTWGDIPYYAYGSDNPDFQALSLGDADEEILAPKYATQAEIYPSILDELKEASEMLDTESAGMAGDKIYFGDVSKWQKFANSLRLRIALKIMAVDAATAQAHIDDAISAGVFESNDDNAAFNYAASDVNASPMYRAYNVDNRTDFAISHAMVQLLKGNDLIHEGSVVEANPFNGLADPRLAVFAKTNPNGDYVGMPISDNSSDAGVIDYESLPGSAIIDMPDYKQVLMGYPEVQFILSELNGWDQSYYEAGVAASLGKWGTSDDDYLANLPAASEATVLTQKFIDMYMDPHTAWQEYRRTGYPKVIVTPGTSYTQDPLNGSDPKSYTFTSLVDGITDIPNRLQYPQFERTLNGDNRAEAVQRLENGDALDSPLWWDVD